MTACKRSEEPQNVRGFQKSMQIGRIFGISPPRVKLLYLYSIPLALALLVALLFGCEHMHRNDFRKPFMWDRG